MSFTLTTPGTPPASDMDTVTGSVRKHLLALLSESASKPSIGIDDDASFDLLGLDSMSRVGLVERIAEEYDLDLDITAAYDFVTVRALAHFVHDRASQGALELTRAGY